MPIKVALIAAALCVVATAGIVLYWRVRVDALVARIRAAGDPTLPSEIVLPPARPGVDPTPWLEELMRLEESDDHWWVRDEEDDAAMLARARANAFPRDECDAIEMLHECRQTSAEWSEENERESWKALNEALAGGIPVSELSPCQRAALCASSMSELPSRAIWERACDLTRHDSLRGMEGWKSPEDAVDAVRFLPPLIRAVRVLTDAAVADACAGMSEPCIHHLHVATCVAHVLDAPTSAMGGNSWRFLHELVVLGGLRRSLPYLAPDADLSQIDDELRSFDVREMETFALKSERARIRWIFNWLRNCTSEDLRNEMRSGVPLGAPLEWLFFGRDEAVCLERCETGFANLREPFYELDRSWLDMPSSDFPKYAPVAAMLTPNFQDAAKAIVASEANLALAHCALTAHRHGADAARSEAARTIDPYIGKPLHSRVDVNGILVLWSVGTNGIDDGGSTLHPRLGELRGDNYEDPEQPLDIVWKVRTD